MQETVITCDETERGFYTYTRTGTGDAAVYDLTEANTLAKGGVIVTNQVDREKDPGQYASQGEDFAYDYTYDDEDGGMKNATITDITNRGFMKGIGRDADDNSFLIDDMPAGGAKIIWVNQNHDDVNGWTSQNDGPRKPRNTDPNERDWDNNIDINSTSRMRDAIYCGMKNGERVAVDQQTNKLLVDMFMENGKPTFIAVVDWTPVAVDPA